MRQDDDCKRDIRNQMTDNHHTQNLEEFLGKVQLNDQWKKWVQVNLEAGCDKNGMFRIMLDEGIEYNVIKEALNFEPAIPVDQLINPLKEGGKDDREDKAHTAVEVSGESPSPFIPNAEKLDHDGIEFFVLDDFLNTSECEVLIDLIRSGLRPSTITGSEAPDTDYRSSSTCDLGLITHDLITDVDRRICSMVGIPAEYSETMQGQHYDVGQEFKAHTDFFEENELEKFGGEGGQRSYTFMIYLNDVEEGGETSFPNINQVISPKRGRAVIWNSLYSDGTVNDNSMHHAYPVVKGNKTVITKWFRTRAGLPVFEREANENIRNYTKFGFEKDRLPKPLMSRIEDFYQQNYSAASDETAAKGFVENSRTGEASSSMIELPHSLRDDIHACLKPVLEMWSGVKLIPTYVYGIRIYHHGTYLKVHRDRLDTHIISAIINVAQDVTRPWPLVIEDNFYRRHNILLAPGEVVYYEGGRLAHGRPEPLEGDLYANIFCHFKPAP